MSGNSWPSALQTAPIVSDLRRRRAAAGGLRRRRASRHQPREVGELVLADLDLVAVLELVRVDPLAVDVGAVERPGVVEVPGALAVHEHAWSRETVTSSRKTSASGRAADRHALAAQRERLADAAAAGADDQRAAAGGDVLDVDRAQLAGRLVDACRSPSSPCAGFAGSGCADERAAALSSSCAPSALTKPHSGQWRAIGALGAATPRRVRPRGRRGCPSAAGRRRRRSRPRRTRASCAGG